MTALTIILMLTVLPATNASGSTSTSTVAQAKQEIRRLWGPQAATAECIVRRESRWNPRAINWRDQHSNGRGSFGLMQIGRVWIGYTRNDWRPLLDPVVNVRVAHRIYQRYGWRPWGGGC